MAGAKSDVAHTVSVVSVGDRADNAAMTVNASEPVILEWTDESLLALPLLGDKMSARFGHPAAGDVFTNFMWKVWYDSYWMREDFARKRGEVIVAPYEAEYKADAITRLKLRVKPGICCRICSGKGDSHLDLSKCRR